MVSQADDGFPGLVVGRRHELGDPAVPVGFELITVGDVQDAFLAEMRLHDLQLIGSC